MPAARPAFSGSTPPFAASSIVARQVRHLRASQPSITFSDLRRLLDRCSPVSASQLAQLTQNASALARVRCGEAPRTACFEMANEKRALAEGFADTRNGSCAASAAQSRYAHRLERAEREGVRAHPNPAPAPLAPRGMPSSLYPPWRLVACPPHPTPLGATRGRFVLTLVWMTMRWLMEVGRPPTPPPYSRHSRASLACAH